MSTRYEFYKAFVTEVLELLPNLILDKIVFRMFSLKFFSKSIDFIKREFEFRNPFNTSQYIQQPTSAVNS